MRQNMLLVVRLEYSEGVDNPPGRQKRQNMLVDSGLKRGKKKIRINGVALIP